MGTLVKGAGHGVVVEVHYQGYFRDVPVIEAKGIDPGSPGPFFQVFITFGEAVKEKLPLGSGLIGNVQVSPGDKNRTGVAV